MSTLSTGHHSLTSHQGILFEVALTFERSDGDIENDKRDFLLPPPVWHRPPLEKHPQTTSWLVAYRSFEIRAKQGITTDRG